jgi:hypothetical protein
MAEERRGSKTDNGTAVPLADRGVEHRTAEGTPQFERLERNISKKALNITNCNYAQYVV